MSRILIVEDDNRVRIQISLQLEDEGFTVTALGDAEHALSLLRGGEADRFALLLCDVRLPGASGIELVRQLASENRLPPTIIVSGEATITEAVDALSLGVRDFLEKPFSKNRLLRSVRNCLDHAALEERVRDLEAASAPSTRILGDSEVMRCLGEQIAKIAPTEGRVLILGESGTGKELVASALHRGSKRADKPFVKLNCAAIPGTLIESELFGHMRGAFTGAERDQPGLFEEAAGGTLFLDEIGDMALDLQSRLLRVLEDGVVRRVGGRKDIRVDVRVLAATHHDLRERVREGSFREDLYFRLAALPLEVPPLRARADDIVLLAEHFLARFCRENQIRPKRLDPETERVLRGYHWPGNVRELRNLCERLTILAGDPIRVADLPSDLMAPETATETGLIRLPSPNRILPLKTFKNQCEKEYLEAVLRVHGWSYGAAADALAIQRTYLHRKITQLGIQRPS